MSLSQAVSEQRRPEGDLATGVAFIDGAFCRLDEARIPIMDQGFLRADVCYDTVQVWKGVFFRLEDHLDRFERSCELLKVDPGYSRDEIREIMTQGVRLTGLREAFCQIICSRGLPTPGASRDPRRHQNRFYHFVRPFDWISPPEQQASGGVHIHISSIPRIPPECIDPRVKNHHRGDLTRGLMEALDYGADTTVLPDFEGNITEGPGFNVFAVKDGAVRTPDWGMLEGVTRRTAIELCQELEIPVEVGKVPADELREADEVFLTSVAGGVMAATRVDDRILGNGVAGPVTAKLRDLYWSKKEADWHATPIDYDD